MITRRDISSLLLAQVVQAQHSEPSSLPELPLSQAQIQELVKESRRAVEQAGLLRELPLDGVAPGFVFVAR